MQPDAAVAEAESQTQPTQPDAALGLDDVAVVDVSTEESRVDFAYLLLARAERARQLAGLAAQHIESAARADANVLTDMPSAAAAGEPQAEDHAAVVQDLLQAAGFEAAAVQGEGEQEAVRLEDEARLSLRGLSFEHCRSVSSGRVDFDDVVTEAQVVAVQRKAARRWSQVKVTSLLTRHSAISGVVDTFAKIQAAGAWDPTIHPALQSDIFSPAYKAPAVPVRGATGREMYYAKEKSIPE